MPLEIVASLGYVAGDSVRLEFAVTDLDGVAANLTGTTIRFAAARDPVTEAVISTETSPPTATVNVTSVLGGLFEVLVEPDVTLPLRGTYRFEAELEDLSGDKATVGRGFITFTGGLV